MEMIGIGDLHLTGASGTGGLSKYVDDHDQQVIKEVQAVLDWAAPRGIEHAVLYGDVCCAPRMSYEGQAQLDKLFRANLGFTFWIILGNHDMWASDDKVGHSLEIIKLMRHPNVRIFSKPRKPKVVNIQQLRVQFLPYSAGPLRQDCLNVMHQEVYGASSDSGRVYQNDDLKALKTKGRLAVSGHLHTAQQVRDVYYSGTLYQTNFGESQKKYFHHIQVDPDSQGAPADWEISLIPHKPRYKLHNVVLESRKDLKVIPRGPSDLVKLIVSEGADVGATDWTNIPQVVEVKAFRSQDELVATLTEDLQEGQSLIVDTSEFFNTWLDASDVEPEMRKTVQTIRRRVLSKAQART